MTDQHTTAAISEKAAEKLVLNILMLCDCINVCLLCVFSAGVCIR